MSSPATNGHRPDNRAWGIGSRTTLWLIATLGVLLIGASSAGAQSIMNTSSVGGQTSWLESFATSGASDNSSNKAWLSVLVKHPVNTQVTGLRIDDDWDSTDEASSASIKSVTEQQPTLAGGYLYSRVNYSYTIPTSNTGMSCTSYISGTRRTDTKVMRIRARLNTGAETPTSSSTIKFVATSQCLGIDDYAYIYDQAQSATSINTGQSVTFTFKGDDKDTSGDSDFDGVRWRMRRVNDGTTTATQQDCDNNGDHAEKSVTATFPNRGRWVVEANLLHNDCSDTDGANPSYWFRLGAVDVNSPASSSPDVSLGATRPQISGNTTITATTVDDADSGQLGAVEAIEWDLNENTSDGVNGFETATIADYTSTASPGSLSGGQLQKTIDTTGMTPGLHTVRARVGDNGALGGADTIRRTNVATTTFLVDHPPTATGQELATETETPLPLTLLAADADSDTLTYTILDQPDNGGLTGAGASRTYTPNAGFAGSDSFTYEVADGFGGTATATVNVRVDPDTTIDVNPTGTLDDRGAHFEFSSHATGAVFECSLDSAAFTACSSPKDYADLPDGSHELRVRAKAAGNTDQSPASRAWTIDAFPSLSIDSAPPADTADIEATFEFTTGEAGATVAPSTDCKLDAGDFRPCSSPITYTDVDDGPHTVEIRATDAYGKTRTRTATWSVDAAGSNTVIDDAPDAHTASTDAHLEFSSPDNSATFECSLDGGAWDVCTPAQDFGSMAEGNHTFKARAVDVNDTKDPTPAAARWRVDLTAPESAIDVGPGDPTNDTTPTFEFSADETGSTFECRVDSNDAINWASCASPYTTGALGEGDHRLDVRATDAVGNVEPGPAQREFEVDLTPPATAITSGPNAGSIEVSRAVTFGYQSPDAGATFQCRLDTGSWRPCDSPASQVYSGLDDGDHTFSVRATDAAGNADPSPPSRTWSIDATAPQTSIASGPSGTVSTADATFALVSDDATAGFECSLDGAAFAACGASPSYGDLADGQHAFEARALDPLGNADATPSRVDWAIDTSTKEAPNQQPAESARTPCTFGADLAYCSDPYLVARAHGTPGARDDKGSGRLMLKANGGGANMAGARFSLPRQVRLRPIGQGGGARVGSLTVFGYGNERVVPLRLLGGRLLAEGEPEVKLGSSGGRTSISNLPAHSRRVRLVLDSPAIRVAVRDCGSARWRAELDDQSGRTKALSAISDVHCKARSR